MKANIISKLEELLANADISAVANKVKDLQREYEQSFSKEMEKAKQEFVDDGGKAKDFVYNKTAEDTKIIQLFEQYRKLKKQDEEKLAAEQNKNLEVKLRIIKDINDLSQLEVNVGSAIKKLQELQLSWKETGAVSPHKYKELQSEYSKAVESFNYNINIFRQLQDHDFKKNTELKLEIIQKINSLIEKDNVKEVEQLIKIYRNDWEEIGPVLQDNWTELKLTYKDTIDKVYAKIKSYYNEMEDRKKQNLDGKKSIVEKAKAFLNELPESDDKWKAKTEQLIKLQEEYKNIGYTEKPAGDIVYREFRNVCDEFFNKKKDFYTHLKEKHATAKQQKMTLIEKAEAFQNETTNWKDTTDKIIRLQDDWKKIANAGPEEPRLFQRFRKACNTFFDAKKLFFEAKESEYSGNLQAKEDLLKKINEFQLSGENATDREELKKFSEAWHAAGLVPAKEKQRINEAFYKKLDELYDVVISNQSEKFLMKFKNKLERFKSSSDSETLLKKEREFLKKQIDEINGSIRTYENNMGFFKNAKGKNDFMTELENKIDFEKSKLKDFQIRMNLVKETIDSTKQHA
jgi:hypothetical protein